MSIRSLPVWCVAGVCALFWQGAATAALSTVQLYEASVPVRNQQAGERARALSTALEAVLVRVSGQRNVRSDPGLAAAISNASTYAQLFRYRNEPVEVTVVNEMGEEERTTEQQLHLWARFAGRAVNELLQRSAFPIWGAERPVILIWLVTEQEGARLLVGGEQGLEFQDLVLDAAETRGIPVLFPLLDLMDQQSIGPGQVWGGFMDDIREASARYAADVILVGRALQDQGDWWSVRWSFWDGERERFWDQRAAELDALLVSGVDAVADTLARRYAVNTAGGRRQSLMVTVRDVNSLKQYARVLSYLQGLTAVESVEPAEVRDNELSLRVAVAGGQDALDQAIALGHTLRPISEAPSRIEDLVASQQTAVYRLMP